MQTAEEKRIAIFGGAFNPPTEGHKQIIKNLVTSGKFERVIVVPSAHHPDGKDMVSFDRRLHWIGKVLDSIRKEFGLEVLDLRTSSVEATMRDVWGRHFNGLTVETLDGLREHRVVSPDAKLTFVMGADNALRLFDGTWVGVDEMLEKCNLCIVGRDEVSHEQFKDEPWYFHGFDIDVVTSSTEIRGHVTRGRMDLVCDKVPEEIRADLLMYYSGIQSVYRELKHVLTHLNRAKDQAEKTNIKYNGSKFGPYIQTSHVDQIIRWLEELKAREESCVEF